MKRFIVIPACILTTILAALLFAAHASGSRPPIPAPTYPADIVMGQPVPHGFECHFPPEEGYFWCERGEVYVAVRGYGITHIGVLMPRDSISVGDLISVWGEPTNAEYRYTVGLYWPGRYAYATPGGQEFSPYTRVELVSWGDFAPSSPWKGFKAAR